MKLGALITALEACPPTSPLRIAAPLVLMPTFVTAYRGYFGDLAIDFTRSVQERTMTVGAFLETLRGAVGAKFIRQGEDFTATADTIVWVANLGDPSNARVDCVYDDDGFAFIGVRMKWAKT